MRAARDGDPLHYGNAARWATEMGMKVSPNSFFFLFSSFLFLDFLFCPYSGASTGGGRKKERRRERLRSSSFPRLPAMWGQGTDNPFLRRA